MKLKRLISCGLVGILTGVGILMNAKVSSAEDKKFTKVLDVNDLCAGDTISIVNETNKTAMSTTQNKNNRGGTTIEISDGCFEASSDVQRILLESGTVENTYAFNVANGYLYASSSSKNYLVTSSEIDTNASWKISISNGNATIKATGSNTRNLIRYNSNNKIFSCYSNGQMDVQIYKLEKKLSYSISFFDGTEEYTEYAKTVEENSKLIRPTDPEKEGYVFVGWYTEPELINVYNFDSPVTADLKLYAKFEEAASVITHTVTFKSDSETTYDTSVVKEGNSVVKPENPIKEGYVFDGWYTDANCTNENAYDFNTPVNTDITLYAKWLAKYTVSFDTDGGSTVESQTVITGNKATKPAVNPTKKGYNFKGWYKDSAHSNEFDFENDTITDNTTIYARFDEPELLSVSEAQQLAKQFVGKNSPDLYKVKGKVSSTSNENQKITIVLKEGSSEFTFYQVEKTETVKVGDIVVGVGYLYYYKSGNTSEFNQKCTYTVLKGVDLFEQLEIKNQLAYHWQTEDSTTYTIDNVSLRFGVNLTEEMKSLEGVKFGAILAKKTDVANINLSEYARACASAAEVVASDKNLKYLEFTNIAAEGGMTSLRLDNLDSALAEEFVVVIYMEYNGKLYVTEQKIASVKVIASEYLKSDLEILKNEQIKGSLNQLSK